MSNLTRTKRIAFEAPDFRPVPGCDLVIFKRVGAGLRFLEEVPAGKEYRPSPLQSRGSLAAFAVSRDPNWDHEVSQRLLHTDGVSSFTLRCALTFQVADPKRLVELIERDPLLRIEKKAIEIFGDAAARLPWDTIAEDEEEMCAEAASLQNVGRFKAFAADYGITIDRVSLSRIVSEEGLVGHLTDRLRRDARHRHKLTLEDVDRAEELRVRARHERFLDTGLESAIEVLRRATSQVGSFDEVELALDKLVSIRSQVRVALGSGGFAALPSQPDRPALVAGNSAPHHGLADLLARLGQAYFDMAPGPSARSLASSALHLIAEILVMNGDEEQVERYRAALAERFSTMLHGQNLTPESSQLFRHLQDIEGVSTEIVGPEAS